MNDVPDLEHLIRQRRELAELVKELDETTLAELHRRAGLSGKPSSALQEGAGMHVRDGFGGGSAEVTVTSSDVARPVEATIVSAAGGQLEERHPDTGELIAPATPDTWQTRTDPVVVMALRIFRHLDAAVAQAAAIRRTRNRLNLVNGSRGRTSSLQGSCACCTRDVLGTASDRLRSGYCEACYRSWVDAGKPGSDPQEPGNARARWEEERRAFLKSGDGRTKRSRVS